MGPAARSTRRRPHIGQRVRRQSETGRTPTWKRRETLSLEEHVGLFFRTCGKTIQGKCRRRSLRKKGGRTGIESDSDLIQTALANLALPDSFPDWRLSQNSMADAQRDGFPLPSATRSARTDSVLQGLRVGFLNPSNISFSMTPSAKRFTPIRRSRASPASRVACCKAASNYSTELSRATSLTRSMS